MIYRIADLFCGAGGTSAGAVEAALALGRTPELTAINHWPVAIATHTANHPGGRHLCTGVDAVNPRELFGEGELDLLWASPECTHHSIARGGKPCSDQSRSTAWCVVRWAEALRPPIILIENVPEFATWGPIGCNGRPLASRKGETFRAWLAALESLGYQTDYRLLCAADYGDPTTRTRLFIQAVRGRRRIVWPEKTHSKETDLLTTRRWAPARDIIDWSLPAGSIFARKKPLSPKTLARIEAGLRKFGLGPYLITTTHGNSGKTNAANWNAHSIGEPIGSVTGATEKALVEPFIVAWDHTSGGDLAGVGSIDEPLTTVVTKARHGVAQPFLVYYYGTGGARPVDAPLDTVTTKDRMGLAMPLVAIDGNRYLLDIRFRMLQPHELALAQGFPADYRFTGTKTDQVKQIGNAVPRRLARAIVGAVLSQRSNVAALVAAEEQADLARGAA